MASLAQRSELNGISIFYASKNCDDNNYDLHFSKFLDANKISLSK